MTDYYDIHAREYYDQTVSADPSGFLSPFIQFLPPQPRILDIGCGSGRDLLWLKQRGFQPTGLERSAFLARLAGKHSGCPVIEGDMEHFDFTIGSWNALMMVGSLVHISHKRFVPVIQKLLSGVASPCVILLTMKAGEGCIRAADGRVFYLWSDAELEESFLRLNLKVATFFRNTSVIGSRESWLGYVLMKYEFEYTVSSCRSIYNPCTP